VTLEALFQVAGAVAAAGWVLLVFFPRARWGAPLVAGALVPMLLALLYVGLIVAGLPGAEGGFGSLADVARLFEPRVLLLAGWVHYLAFDLFVGAWEVRDAARQGVPHWVVVPCLVLTLLLGPSGLLAYVAVRAVRARTLRLA
jgi:hypothetical protein